ncbi:MAG: hypothetical protein JXQ75_07675 [Phycisphaerae bacterium]|nr:hypothetical protein [Phycisphaerae bacterium]
MQHHLDEFSVTDVRHALQEAWRVVCFRRWCFIFPFCIATTLALLCSLWVPRKYTTRTVIKREQDPVFANMMGLKWTHPYAEIRERMLADLRDEEVIEGILDELGLLDGLERFEDGELTPESLAVKDARVKAVSKGLSTESLESSGTGDVVCITLRMFKPEYMPEILGLIRDKYITSAKKRTIELLQDVKQFFETESERCRGELRELQRELVEYELKYPGIDPSHPDAGGTERTTLTVERLSLERKLAELKSQRVRLVGRLARGADAAQDNEATDDALVVARPNERYMELVQEVNKLLRDIADRKALQGMTEQHPVIQQLRIRMEARREELARTPRQETSLSRSAEDDSGQTEMLATQRLTQELADVDAKIDAHTARLATLDEQISKVERGRALAIDHRQDYSRLKEQAQRTADELISWQQNLSPIQHIFLVEDRDRTLHFATVKDVQPIARPSSPDAGVVTLICLAIGGAVGALWVLLTELMDRSFRTIKQLKSSLGISVIESIDEIMTEAGRRRRLARSLILVPGAASICIGAMAIAGLMAYLSIENPGEYELLKSAPMRACQFVLGQG